tara:strand:+ start:577 stop:1230 length:654 start_codon:yes stop_codon:yes gene_type:complete
MINYWDLYYSNKKTKFKPSNFVKQVIKKKFINKKSVIIELGCGDGRDTFFFSRKVKKIYAFDKSIKIINRNKKLQSLKKIKNISFKAGDIKNNKIFDKIKKKKFSIIYARFFIHAINEKLENRLFNKLKLMSPLNCHICLEFRTTKDKLMKKGKKISKYERITDHYRRFININDFIKKIKKYNFEIIEIKQGINFSKFGSDNPHICRLILKMHEKKN